MTRHGRSTCRFVFLDPQARTFFLDWHKAANDTVATLRIEAGRNPHDRAQTDLVGELSIAAKSSVPAGPRTTYASTAPGSKTSITQSSATYI